MDKKILSILACPKCKKGLGLGGVKEGNDRIEEGFLICNTCKKRYPIIQGIPVFKAGLYLKPVVRIRKLSLKQLKAKILEAQRRKYLSKFLKHTRVKREEVAENRLLGIASGVKRSNLHLDWATGRGRLLKYILKTKRITHIVTLDLDIQECAALQKYLKTTTEDHNRVSIICGDSRQMPFRNNSFHSITSLGGLSEQRESKKALAESIRVLKNNKKMALSGVIENNSFEEIEGRVNSKIKNFQKLINKSNIKNFKSRKIKYHFLREGEKRPAISYVIYTQKM